MTTPAPAVSSAGLDALQAFQWSRQPAAEAFLRGIVREFLAACPPAARLAERMQKDAGTRFFDWIDSFALPQQQATEARLKETGFALERQEESFTIFRHPEGMFPRIALSPSPLTHIAIKADSVADFLSVNQLEIEIEGEPLASMRRAAVARTGPYQLDAIERRGPFTCIVPPADARKALLAAEHLERFRRRQRIFKEESDGFRHANALVDLAIRDLGRDQTCALFFAAEREYWQRRNRAAQVQKARQDRLGLGWGNHDHHTYRSSRICFRGLICFHEKLGLECRERFYAGREAGWGAQVMENPHAGIITFNDVDLAPEELLADFAHEALEPRTALGTVGLWCGLHGEAFLQAGMHHLECQFDFDALQQQLERDHAIQVMKPFTDYPYLRQAFTQGERWPVAEDRLQRLLAAHLITPEQAQQFRSQGAIGSHLENLERNEGYKGFNQKGVSEIISATDPRRQAQLQSH